MDPIYRGTQTTTKKKGTEGGGGMKIYRRSSNKIKRSVCSFFVKWKMIIIFSRHKYYNPPRKMLLPLRTLSLVFPPFHPWVCVCGYNPPNDLLLFSLFETFSPINPWWWWCCERATRQPLLVPLPATTPSFLLFR